MRNKAIYDKSKCSICRQLISENGFGYTSHMRKHVRNGEATESRDNLSGRWQTIFRPKQK
jgi:hypothetical protein